MASAASGSAAPANAYNDLSAIKVLIHRTLLTSLKAAAREMNESPTLPWSFAINVRKAEIVTRLQTAFETAAASNSYAHYTEGTRILNKHVEPRFQRGPAAVAAPAYPAYPAQHVAYAAGGYGTGGVPGNRYPNPYALLNGYPGSLNYQANRPAPAAVQPPRPAAETPTRMGAFKESPFFTISSWVAPPVLCLPTQRFARLKIQLSQTDRDALRDAKSAKQLRLFCTTKQACLASMSGRHPAPVEFPLLSDIRLRGIGLGVKVGGKKTPAKVLPPNLNATNNLDLISGRNEIELVYGNAHQSYVIAAAVCVMTTSEELADWVKTNRVKSKENVVLEMKKAADDDDIEVGDVTLQLKCPLSYARLSMPCRSDICAHNQCFDALSFFMFNEQTPTWQCPICSKTIDPKTLFIDGYVLDILQRVPEEEDAVNIDAAGRWRTLDNKYRSDLAEQSSTSNGATGTSEAAAEGEQTAGPSRVKNESQSTPTLGENAESMSRSNSRTDKAPAIEVFDLDDSPSPPSAAPPPPSNGFRASAAVGNDSTTTISNGDTVQNHSTDSNPIEVSRPTFAARQTATASSSTAQVAGVIDLTFSDSEEDEPAPRRPPPPVATEAPRTTTGPFGAVKPDIQNALRRSMWELPASRHNLPSNVQPLDRFLVPTNAVSRASASVASPAPAPAETASTFSSRSISTPPVPGAAPTVSQGPSRSGLTQSASFSGSSTFSSWGAMSTGPFAAAAAAGPSTAAVAAGPPTAAAVSRPAASADRAISALPSRSSSGALQTNAPAPRSSSSSGALQANASAPQRSSSSSALQAKAPAMQDSSDSTVEDASLRLSSRDTTGSTNAKRRSGAHVPVTSNNGTASSTGANNHGGHRRTYEERDDDDTEDEEQPVVRPRKRGRNTAGSDAILDEVDRYDAEFEDMDFDDFELDPAAGFGGGSSGYGSGGDKTLRPKAPTRSEKDAPTNATTSGAHANSGTSNLSATPAARNGEQRSRDSTLSELSIDERAGLAANIGDGSSVTADSE